MEISLVNSQFCDSMNYVFVKELISAADNDNNISNNSSLTM